MLKHCKLVAYRKSKRTAASAFTQHYRNNGSLQRHKLGDILCYSFALTSLFCVYSAECAGSINKTDNGAVEFFRLICKSQRFSVALGVRHRKVRLFVFVQISSLYLCYDGNGSAVQRCYTCHYSRIVTEMTVTVKLDEMIEYSRNIIIYRRTVFFSDYLKMLCSSQI